MLLTRTKYYWGMHMHSLQSRVRLHNVHCNVLTNSGSNLFGNSWRYDDILLTSRKCSTIHFNIQNNPYSLNKHAKVAKKYVEAAFITTLPPLRKFTVNECQLALRVFDMAATSYNIAPMQSPVFRLLHFNPRKKLISSVSNSLPQIRTKTFLGKIVQNTLVSKLVLLALLGYCTATSFNLFTRQVFKVDD